MTEINESDLEDKTLVCKDCGNKFVFTAGEQKFFLDKGLQNLPKRCKPCSATFKAKLREKHEYHWIACKKCGKKTEVTFLPKSDDIYCEDCFKEEITNRNQKIKAMGEEIPE